MAASGYLRDILGNTVDPNLSESDESTLTTYLGRIGLAGLATTSRPALSDQPTRIDVFSFITMGAFAHGTEQGMADIDVLDDGAWFEDVADAAFDDDLETEASSFLDNDFHVHDTFDIDTDPSTF